MLTIAPVMAERPDASMAGDEGERTLLNTTGPTGTNSDLLRELQGSIHFEKTLTPANVPNGVPNSRCSLEIPQWFVEKHGEKFEEYIILRCGTSAQPRVPWVVRISVSAFPLIRMSCGWKKFAAFNGLREGNSLVFCLRALSEFEVHVFPGNGHPIPSSFSVLTPVDALCEPMGKIMTLGDHQHGTVSATSHITALTSLRNSSHRTLHPGFTMENSRVSALRSSRFPPVEHEERAVSFAGDGSVFVDVTRSNDRSQHTISSSVLLI